MKTLTTLAFTLVATAALAASAPVSTVVTEKGDVLAGKDGMTLYTFKNDKAGQSNCYDACAANWPPFIAAADAAAEGDFSLVSRKDGSLQWARNGMPLYYWTKDKKMGDVTGDGVKGVWDAARP
jgi:predicted lipoprotein with Yx(FWY)xxD motif